MKFISDSVSRKVAGQVLLARKHSPTILFGVGIVSMVGSTVLACNATLKLEKVLDQIEKDTDRIVEVKEGLDSGRVKTSATYSDEEVAEDIRLTRIQGMVKVAKLYAPSIILGGVGIVCLTKSHSILKERNLALTAAYLAVDQAFQKYRERVIDRFGEELDRELRYDFQEVEIIDDETGKLSTGYIAGDGDPGQYARWFTKGATSQWNPPHLEEYNWLFLRQQQNWCNDMLHSRGYVFLNEVYGALGLSHTTAGQVVGWVYVPENENGDNMIDFQCWDQQENPQGFNIGQEGAILLDFNVDGPVMHLIDEMNGHKK